MRAKGSGSMICKLRPACKAYIWGGRRLIEEYGKGDGAGNLAESWELSCHPDGPSIAADGPYAGRSLPEILAERPEFAGRAVESLGRFPVLVKLIDAARDLSVQVHPDDAYTLKHEGQLGKTEMWYIIDAEPGAGLYCGFRREVTPAQLHTAIEGNTLCELLRRVPVKAGDVVFIPAGTVHAIGAGILLAEIQQSSSVTYRLYDYGRLGADGKPRELHIDKALDVAALSPAPASFGFGGHLGDCRYFTADLFACSGQAELYAGEDSFLHLLVIEGELELGGLHAGKGESVFISADSGSCTVRGEGKAILTYVKRP